MKKLILLLAVLFVVSCSKDPIIYTLTTSANPADGGTVSPSTQQYEEGKTATITATASSEYLFQSWSGATGSTNSTSVVMNSDKSVTANFVKKKYALTTTVEGEGTVSEKVIKTGVATDYNSGTIVELTAVPSGEWLFVEWKGDLIGTENPAQITVDKAKNVTAVFVKKPAGYLDTNGITVKANSWANVGDTVNINGEIYTVVDLEMLKQMISEEKDISKVITTLITNMEGLFNRSKFNGDISSWDVSNVTDMRQMFYFAHEFNQEIGNWDVGNVTDMSQMFYDANNFNQDIGNWDVGNVTDMQHMFTFTDLFNQDISSWDVSSVTNMGGMFSKLESFNADIGSWDVSNVTNMAAMFIDAKSFNQDIGNWDVRSVKDISSIFQNCHNFNQDISNWDVSNVTNMSGAFSRAYEFNQDIGNWDVGNVTNMAAMFIDAKSFNQDISSWDVSNVTEMTNMFSGAEEFNQDIGNWDVSNVSMIEDGYVTGFDYMFFLTSSFSQDLSRWCVEKISIVPNYFAHESNYYNEKEKHPKWGESCD